MNAHARHVDDETLALLALGEPAPSSDVAAHVRDCGTCRTELSSLQHVTAVARQVDGEDRATQPPPPDHVWNAILHDIAEDRGATPLRPPEPLRSPGSAVDAGRQPRGRQPWLAAAAAVVLVAVVAVAAILPRLSPDVVAETTLEAVESDRTVEARLLRSGDVLRLEVDTGDLPRVDGYYEVWLADVTVERLVSLGPLTSGEPLVLPAAVDVSEFPVVDVSVEPLDGDPTHSGDSLWRGELPVG